MPVDELAQLAIEIFGEDRVCPAWRWRGRTGRS
jgi:hypothetical protein